MSKSSCRSYVALVEIVLTIGRTEAMTIKVFEVIYGLFMFSAESAVLNVVIKVNLTLVFT